MHTIGLYTIHTMDAFAAIGYLVVYCECMIMHYQINVFQCRHQVTDWITYTAEGQ